MGTRGVWSLENVEVKYPQDDWVDFPDVYLLDNDVGHFRDQNSSDGPLTRTNLGLELTSYAPGITNITRWGAGSSCQTHALFAGGGASGATSAPAISSTYKLTYSSYTSARAPAADLPIPKAISIGVASEDNAYINSGYEGGGSPAGQTGTCKISFATDTTTNLPSANINAINWEVQSLTDGDGGGYLFGGTWIPGQASIGSRCYKITYANDGLALLPGSNTVWNPSETNRNPETSRAGMMNRTAGYQSGGNSFPGSDGSSMTTKLTYSSMVWSVVPGAYLPNPRRKAASGTGNTKAWYGCGQQSGNQSNFTLLDFSDETWSAVPGMNHPGPSSSGQESANTSTSPRDSLKGADKSSGLGDGYNYGLGAVGNNKGYKKRRWYDNAAWSSYGGGSGVDFDGTGDYLTSNAAYVDMSDSFCVEAYVKWDTMGTPSNMGMICSQYEHDGTTNGRMLFGSQQTNNLVVRINGGSVELETGSNTITTGTWYHTAWTWDGTTHRLFLDGVLKDTATSSDIPVVLVGTETEIGGQSTLGGYSIDGKISNFRVVQGDAVYTEDFSIPTTGILTNITGTGLLCCQSGVGVTVTAVGTVAAAGDPTVFTDDKTLPINKSPLATPTASTAITENPAVSTVGYWSGGAYPIKSITDKLTFSNDTTARVPGANTSPARHNAAGSSSTTKGYANGGYQSWEASPTPNINSLTYSNNTWANIPSGLSNPSARMLAVNNLTHSYAAGGGTVPGTSYSQIDKLDFASETPSKNIAQLIQNGATGRQYGTGVGNPTAGYFCGGTLGPSPSSNTSEVSKLTYSTTTVTSTPSLTVVKEPSTAIARSWSFGKNDVGYVCGGRPPGSSTVNKLTYSTDTRSFAPTLWANKYDGEAVSSNQAGYAGGYTPSGDQIYKMPYSTESWTYTPSANLSANRYLCTGFSDAMNSNGFPASPVLI